MLRSFKLTHFIAETIPARTSLAGEQFKIRAVAIALDTAKEFIRLARVLAARGEDQFAHILCLAPAIAAAGKQHLLGLVPYRVAGNHVEVVKRKRALAVPRGLGLHPGETSCAELETPGFN